MNQLELFSTSKYKRKEETLHDAAAKVGKEFRNLGKVLLKEIEIQATKINHKL